MDKVSELMVPISDYPTLSSKATFEEAINLMYSSSKDKGYRWVLVMNDDEKITGILTLRAVFEALGSLATKSGGWLGISFNRPEVFFWDGLKLIKDNPVTKYVRSVVDAYVMENDPPARAMELILKRKITILPVLDKNLKVVGIVRPVDLLSFVKKLFDTDLA